MSETQNSSTTENQTQIKNQEIPEEIANGIRNHHTKKYMNGNRVLLLDFETTTKEPYDTLGFNLSKLLLGQNYTTSNEDIEIVDELSTLYPGNQIFLVTQLNHIRKHYIYGVLSAWREKKKAIEQFEEQIKSYNVKYRLYINREAAIGVGVEFRAANVPQELIEDIMEEIAQAAFKEKGFRIDKDKVIESRKRYIIFVPNEFIYRNSVIRRYLFNDVTDDPEDVDEDYVVKEIFWYTFTEVSSLTINNLLDP